VARRPRSIADLDRLGLMRVVVLGRLDERVDVEVSRGVARAVDDLPAALADDLDDVRAVTHASFA
jgi:hypothetical protein